MKFQVKIGEDPSNDVMTALAIDPSTSEIIAACDDKTLTVFNSQGERLADNGIDSYVTSMSFLPSPGKANTDLIAAACSDGTVLLMRRDGSVEKKFKAHDHGASTCVQWSSDGASLASSGEDGEVKIWSRSANVRTTFSFAPPVLACRWGPEDDALVVASRNTLNVHRTQGQGKPIQWQAQPKDRGVVLTVDWSSANNLIVCGGEDCCFRIFDSLGLPLFVSAPNENAITSLAWSPNGKTFAVGSFNTLMLCDQSGWSHHRESVGGVGSVLDMEWRMDGTQLVGAGGMGVILANIVGKTIECEGRNVQQVEPNRLIIAGSTSFGNDEHEEEIEVSSEPIVDFCLGFGRLVVCNTSNCYVYSLPDVSSPACVVDLKGSVLLLVLSATNFAIVGTDSGMTIYTLDGRYLSSPRFQGLQKLTEDKVSTSPDTLAIVDHIQLKTIRLFDVASGKPTSEIVHDTAVTEVSLSQQRGSSRQVAFIDGKDELFVCCCSATTTTNLPASSSNKEKTAAAIMKLGTHVRSMAWNETCDVLVSAADSRLVVYYYPNATHADRDILELASETLGEHGSEAQHAQFGNNPRIVSFAGSVVTVRRMEDGALLTETVSPFPAALHQLVGESKWEEALRLCRFVDSPQLWATLMGLSRQQNGHEQLDNLVENWNLFNVTPSLG